MEQTPFEESNHETVFDVPLEHIIQSSSGKGWNGLDVAEVIHPLDDFALPAIPRHVLVINLDSSNGLRNEILASKMGNVKRLHEQHSTFLLALRLYFAPVRFWK